MTKAEYIKRLLTAMDIDGWESRPRWPQQDGPEKIRQYLALIKSDRRRY